MRRTTRSAELADTASDLAAEAFETGDTTLALQAITIAVCAVREELTSLHALIAMAAAKRGAER